MDPDDSWEVAVSLKDISSLSLSEGVLWPRGAHFLVGSNVIFSVDVQIWSVSFLGVYDFSKVLGYVSLFFVSPSPLHYHRQIVPNQLCHRLMGHPKVCFFFDGGFLFQFPLLFSFDGPFDFVRVPHALPFEVCVLVR